MKKMLWSLLLYGLLASAAHSATLAIYCDDVECEWLQRAMTEHDDVLSIPQRVTFADVLTGGKNARGGFQNWPSAPRLRPTCKSPYMRHGDVLWRRVYVQTDSATLPTLVYQLGVLMAALPPEDMDKGKLMVLIELLNACGEVSAPLLKALP